MPSKNNSIEAGTVYVSVTSDTSKLTGELAEGLDEAVTKAGGPAGEKLGQELGSKAASKAGSTIQQDLSANLKRAGVVAGAAAAAGVLAGIGRAADGKNIESSIQAQLDTTPQYAKEVAKAAGAAYNEGWGESLGDVAKVATVAAQSIQRLNDPASIEGLTESAHALASGFDQDAAQVIQAADQLVTTGLAGSMDDAMDIVTKGFQSGSKMSEDWLDTLNEYSTQFRDLGLSGQDALGLVKESLDGGARSSDLAADALKEFALRGAAGADLTKTAFKDIGLNADDMVKAIAAGGPTARKALGDTLDSLRKIEDPVKRNTAAVSLFGTQAEDLGDALFSMDLKPLQDVDISGTAQKFAENSKSFEQSMTGLGRSLADALGAALLPVVPIIDSVVGLLLQFLSWLKDNPVITTILLAIAGAIAAVAAAQWAWNAAQLANPATWILIAIVAAIALVVAGVVWMVDNWKTAGQVIEDVINSIIGFINMLLKKWNDLPFGDIAMISKVELGGTKKPKPHAANGGTIARGGEVRVGEFGPENLFLPAGARVEPLPDNGPASQSSKGVTVNQTFVNPVAEKSSASARRSRNALGAAMALA